MIHEHTELQRALAAAIDGDAAALRPMLPAYGLADTDQALSVLRSFPSPGEAPWTLALLPGLMAEGARSPDALMALNNWERFLEAAHDPAALAGRMTAQPVWIEILTALFSQSQFLAGVAARYPETIEILNDPAALYAGKTLEHYRDMASRATMATDGLDETRAALRRWQLTELFRIGARDLLGAASVDQVTGELSMLAESVIEAAWRAALEQMTRRYGEPRLENPDKTAKNDDAAEAGAECAMCVYGMGKLGGSELNFSSDVDLIFIYDGEGETTGRSGEFSGGRRDQISNHEFFTKVCEALIRFLTQHTDEGPLYRVDVRLRPEGHSGPLIRSLVAYENYFFSQGRIWEKAAYLKARKVAGSDSLARRFNRLVAGFCFTPETPERIRRNLVEIKRLIDGNIGPNGSELDIKRGRGGIRELEFSISAMQLIHGGREPALRPKNYWTAVDALHRHGLIAAEERDRMTQAYDFMRTIEHRLQIMEDRQTHEMPSDAGERHKLALRMGLWPDLPARKKHDAFEQRLREDREFTHALYLTTLDAKDEEEQTPEDRVLSALYHPDFDGEVLLARLAQFGIEKKSTVGCLLSMARGSSEVYVSARGQRLFRQVLPHILDECRRVPFPDDAIRNLDNFLHAAMGVTSYYSLFLESAGVRKLILRLLGTSNYCARLLTARPELFDALLEWGLPPDVDYAKLIADYYRGAARSMKSPEARLDFLRLFKQQEWLRIVLRDLFAAGMDAARVAGELSRLAELCLGVAAEAAFARAAEKFDLDAGTRAALNDSWTIAALGSFGGEMLSYFSDLDVLFVYDPPAGAESLPVNLTEFFTLWANDVINIMSRAHEKGDLFKTDARLRPEGRSAPIVAPLDRHIDYYANSAQTWEFQTATKMRLVAGNPEIGRKWREAVHQQMARFARDDNWIGDLILMRRRLEESVKKPDWAAAEFKRGPGGLADIDFILQALVLRHAAALKEIPASKTETIAALRQLGILDEIDGAALLANFQFLKKLEARIRLMFETTENLMPADVPRSRALAVAMSTSEGTLTPERLLSAFQRTVESNRRLFEKFVGLL